MPVATYRLHDLTIAVEPRAPGLGEPLRWLLPSLSFVPADSAAPEEGAPTLRLSVDRFNGRDPVIPRQAREILRTGGGPEPKADEESYLTLGRSVFHLRPAQSAGTVTLAPCFAEQSALDRANFWICGVLKLLRPHGVYSLHAAALVAPKQQGVLIVAPSSSGKSTLTIGLIRAGWGYLSDDAVLLCHRLGRIEVLALRKDFFVDADAAGRYPDLPLGKAEPDSTGGERCPINMQKAFPGQYVSHCIPRLLLFPRIVARERSCLRPLDRIAALGRLLDESGPALFDRATMDQHLAVIKGLVQQAACFEIESGRDLYQNPAGLADLLAELENGPSQAAEVSFP